MIDEITTMTDEHHEDETLLEQILDKLYAIELDTLDIQQELVRSREGHDWNFFVIPITVLILLAGLSVGLYFESLVGGFIGGAIIALLVGYGYHLWDEQWQKAATLTVLSRINEIEGDEGFLHWFKPVLARSAYRTMFYKLKRMHIVDIPMYTRALHRLQEKERDKLRERLMQCHPELIPHQPEVDTPADTAELEQHPQHDSMQTEHDQTHSNDILPSVGETH